MKDKWHYIDNLISNSFEEVQVNDNYNCKLFNSLCEQENMHKNLEKKKTAAISLVLSGMMMLVLNTSSLNYKIVNIKTDIKTSISYISCNYLGGINIENMFFGE